MTKPEQQRRYNQSAKGRARNRRHILTPEAKMIKHFNNTSPSYRFMNRLRMQITRSAQRGSEF